MNISVLKICACRTYTLLVKVKMFYDSWKICINPHSGSGLGNWPKTEPNHFKDIHFKLQTTPDHQLP